MKVGVFGGSFDPIHNGHINLAKYVLDHTDLDEVWLMVSPLNPLKPQGYVATDDQRLDMARLAVADLPGIKISDFEFSLPIPSYTYNTLTKLKEAYPDIDFRLIIGGDNWAHFDRWRNPQEILDQFGLIVYPRPGEKIKTPANSQLIIDNSSLIILEGAPLMPVSSTRLRTLLNSDSSEDLVGTHGSRVRERPISDFLPEKVLDYILRHHLYTLQK
ncbi:MAG: nicotinate (nicotinamide) nucleotide adenylyltransferase [Muribaculaceae bacterium]|nr:nicotinate (nicotinamide) nucleotide adenylyltransferase [Muribaculaceae bacterium]